MDANTLSAAAGLLLSLAAAYLPGFSDWYGALPGAQKRLVMLALLAAVALASVGLACAGLGDDLGLPLTCDAAGVWTLLRAFLAALTANQATYLLSQGARCPPQERLA